MARDNEAEDEGGIEPVNIGDPSLPPDMTHEKMARMQGFDTTPTRKSKEERARERAEEELEHRRKHGLDTEPVEKRLAELDE